jgi:hypothetical protein
LIKPDHYYTLFNKTWAVEESIRFKSQSICEDKQVYGFTLEVKAKDSAWMPYWNYKVYSSVESATEAFLKCYAHNYSNQNYEFRVRPLYVMTDAEFRDFKIDKLLKEESTQSPKPKKQPQFFTVKEDFNLTTGRIMTIKRGSVFCKYYFDRCILIKDQRTRFYYGFNWIFNKLEVENVVEKVDISDVKWIIPHLPKQLKVELGL